MLGSRRYREIEDAHTQALLKATLEALVRSGELVADDVNLLSRMVDAMICEVALLLPEAKDAKSLRKHGQKIIASLLDGLKPA